MDLTDPREDERIALVAHINHLHPEAEAELGYESFDLGGIAAYHERLHEAHPEEPRDWARFVTDPDLIWPHPASSRETYPQYLRRVDTRTGDVVILDTFLEHEAARHLMAAGVIEAHSTPNPPEIDGYQPVFPDPNDLCGDNDDDPPVRLFRLTGAGHMIDAIRHIEHFVTGGAWAELTAAAKLHPKWVKERQSKRIKERQAADRAWRDSPEGQEAWRIFNPTAQSSYRRLVKVLYESAWGLEHGDYEYVCWPPQDDEPESACSDEFLVTFPGTTDNQPCIQVRVYYDDLVDPEGEVVHKAGTVTLTELATGDGAASASALLYMLAGF